MIRLFGFLIRCCLSVVLVFVCVVFFGPYLVQVVDKWAGRAEAYPSAAERFQPVARVWDLLEEKGLGELEFRDLMEVFSSDESSEESSAHSEQLREFARSLTADDIETLRDVSRSILTTEPAMDEGEPALSEDASQLRSSEGGMPGEGL